jgi:hypothetical protein
MGLGSFLKKAAMQDDDVKAAVALGGLAKKAGKGIAGIGFATSDKLKKKDKTEEVEPAKETVPTENAVPAKETPAAVTTADTDSIQSPPIVDVNTPTAGIVMSYSLGTVENDVRCPECGAVVVSGSEKCPECDCQIAGNPAVRRGPL